MTPGDFIAKWRASELKERSAITGALHRPVPAPGRADAGRGRSDRRHLLLRERRPQGDRGCGMPLDGLSRYTAPPKLAKHRLFTCLDLRVCRDHQLIVIARDDTPPSRSCTAASRRRSPLRLGSSLDLEDRPRYTPTTMETSKSASSSPSPLRGVFRLHSLVISSNSAPRACNALEMTGLSHFLPTRRSTRVTIRPTLATWSRSPGRPIPHAPLFRASDHPTQRDTRIGPSLPSAARPERQARGAHSGGQFFKGNTPDSSLA